MNNYNCCFLKKENFELYIDKFNNNLITFIEKLDKEYSNLGEYILKKFNEFKTKVNKKNYTYQYTNIVNSPTPSSENTYQENVSIIISDENINESNITRRKLSNNSDSNSSIEMIPKHYVDNKESFLDEAWDIIAG